MYQIVVQSDGDAYRSERDKLQRRNESELEERFRQLGGTIFISHENGFRIFAMVPRTQKEMTGASIEANHQV